jgi:CheY-like chemotaxis protein
MCRWRRIDGTSRSRLANTMLQERGSARTIVVVEDDPLVRTHAAMMLDDLGYSVVACDTAEEAFAVIEKAPDGVMALFTDVTLAGTSSGLRLARQVAQRWPEIGILIASGRVLPQEEDLPPKALFISKPWIAEDVIAALAPPPTE